MSFRIVIPKGTDVARCPRGCGVAVYWVEQKRAGSPHSTVRIPVDTNCEDGTDPDSWSPGRGQNHFFVCEA